MTLSHGNLENVLVPGSSYIDNEKKNFHNSKLQVVMIIENQYS
jgi:hypothetical protein